MCPLLFLFLETPDTQPLMYPCGLYLGPKDKFTLDGTSALAANVGLRWYPLASGISNLASGRLKLVPLWTATTTKQAGGSLSHPKLQECGLASDSTETPRYPRSTRQESILIHHWFPEVTEGHFIRLSALKNSKMVIKIHVWVLGNVVYCRSL